MKDGGLPSYHVSVSGKVAAEIKQFAKYAAAQGKRDLFIAALEKIHQRLREDPSEFGEYRFGLQTLKLNCYIGAVRPLAVQFAVHKEQPIVFLLKVTLMEP